MSVLVAGCGGDSGGRVGQNDDGMSAAPAACSASRLEALEAGMSATLSQTDSEVDFSFSVQRRDGRRYDYNRGSSTLQKIYQSASTSKLVAAVMILRLVDQGYLNLADRPQDRIQTWPILSTDALYGMTLAHLLSLTSGLNDEPSCVSAGTPDLETCVVNIANNNAGRNIPPGQQFFYANTHHQVAGLMAARARGTSSWQDVFAEFKTQTGLFARSTFDQPSGSNPQIAGGMLATGEEYMEFLKALKDGLLLTADSMTQLLADRTASVDMVFSPIVEGIGGGPGLGEDWHYGFGLWHECRSATFSCVPGTRVSSPGNFGSYPFWDRSKGYTGVVVRQGVSGTLARGIAIERAVQPIVEQWADC